MATLEFALILPFLLLVVVGMLGFGRILNYWIDANHLANEGARWVVVDRNPGTGPGVGAAPCNALSGLKLQQHLYCQAATDEMKQNLAVCVDYPGKTVSTVEIGDPVRVRVKRPVTFGFTFPFTSVTPISIGFTITGTSTMRVENIVGSDPTTNPTDNVNSGSCT